MERNPTLSTLAEQEMDVWLMNDLLAKPATLSRASKYTAMNGVLYLCAGALLAHGPAQHRRFSWIELLSETRRGLSA